MYCTDFPDCASNSIFYFYLCFQTSCSVKIRHGVWLLYLSVAYITVFRLKEFETDFNSSLCLLLCASWLKCGFNFFNCIYRRVIFNLQTK